MFITDGKAKFYCLNEDDTKEITLMKIDESIIYYI